MRIPLPTTVLLLAFLALTKSSELPSLPLPQATQPTPTIPNSLLSYNSALPVISDHPTNGSNSSFFDPEDKRGGGGSSGGGHGGGGGGHGDGEGSSGSKSGGTVVGGAGADSEHGSSTAAHSMATRRNFALLGLYVFWIGKGVARMMF